MTGLSWYPLYPGDYARDTQQLSLLEHGAYRLLMDHYYSTGSLDCLTKRSSFDPSNDDQTIINERMYRLCRAISEEEKNAVDVVLKLFFTYEKGKYFNKKIEKVIIEQQEKHQKKRDAAKKAVEAREKKRREKDVIKRSSFDGSNDHQTIIKRSSNQNQNQNNGVIKPLTPLKSKIDNKLDDEFVISLSKGASGVLKPCFKGGEKKWRVDNVMNALDDGALAKAKENAPTWDIYHLAEIYVDGINSGKREAPKSVKAAFPAWCLKYTKGMKP